jgi:hypothetical protein
VCYELVDNRATALLLLVGHPEPAVSIVRSVRRDRRLAEIMIGAPAGQPEFAEWATALGDDSAAIPFLRYLAEVLRSYGTDRARTAASWPHVSVEGTRGKIQFSRTPGISVWQWTWPPIQVVDRDPAEPGRFRILHTS